MAHATGRRSISERTVAAQSWRTECARIIPACVGCHTCVGVPAPPPCVCGNNKVTVACLAPSSGHCVAFSSTIPPLQVALSFACSVASLSHSPSFQLPGWHSLHCGSLADYLLGWGRASTCTAGHTRLQCTPLSKPPKGNRSFLPAKGWCGSSCLVFTKIEISRKPPPLSPALAL